MQGRNIRKDARRNRRAALRKELLLSREMIGARVRELAGEISEDYRGKEPLLVSVLKGSVFFFADLVREITLPSKIDFVRAASYGKEMNSCGSVRLTKDLELPVEGKSILLVEDIVDTGLTLSYITGLLADRGAESIKICALVDKLERRERHVPIDYCGFKVEEGFLVGYGLDFDEKYRSLPEIFILKE